MFPFVVPAHLPPASPSQGLPSDMTGGGQPWPRSAEQEGCRLAARRHPDEPGGRTLPLPREQGAVGEVCALRTARPVTGFFC